MNLKVAGRYLFFSLFLLFFFEDLDDSNSNIRLAYSRSEEMGTGIVGRYLCFLRVGILKKMTYPYPHTHLILIEEL
jgi:hypothetical protein